MSSAARLLYGGNGFTLHLHSKDYINDFPALLVEEDLKWPCRSVHFFKHKRAPGEKHRHSEARQIASTHERIIKKILGRLELTAVGSLQVLVQQAKFLTQQSFQGVQSYFGCFWQNNIEPMVTFSTGPKLISSGRFGWLPPHLENPAISFTLNYYQICGVRRPIYYKTRALHVVPKLVCQGPSLNLKV